MKLVQGFSKASKVMDRRRPQEAHELNHAIKSRLKEMFGVETAEEAVEHIIGEVKVGGDPALVKLARLIDGVEISSPVVSPDEVRGAVENIGSQEMMALEIAAERIRSFHEEQRRVIPDKIGVNNCYQISQPLNRVGVYAPGGTACYPSSVLMTAIPAKCAGVSEVFLATPAAKDGKIPALTLAASSVAGVDRVFCIGGAQAIAAMAYGTQTIGGVDKICGPGNIFVMLAKKMVFGVVDIDGLQGPSEVIIIAGDESEPGNVVNEILAQAEHDPMAQSILITRSPDFAKRVIRLLEEKTHKLTRSAITSQSLQTTGLVAVVNDFNEAVQLTNLYAPEHLVLDGFSNDFDYTRFTSSGCIFAGRQPTVAMGDYVSGPSHALPTGGTARFSSPLNVNDFIRYYNVVEVTSQDLENYGPAAATLARAEGLEAHAEAVECRLKNMRL